MTCSPPRRHASFRSPALVLAVAVALLAAHRVAGGHGEPSGQPESQRVSRAGVGETWIRHGDDATARGEFRQADGAYRWAWESLETRTQAASALTRLHTAPGFVLPVDESIVRATVGQLDRGFVRHETAHFVVLSDCRPDWTRARGILLERTRQQFFRATARLGLPVFPHEHKLLVVLFNNQDRYAAFARANDGLETPWVAGYYATRANRAVFFNDTSSSGFTKALTALDSDEREVRETRARADAARRSRNDDLANNLYATAEDMSDRIERERERLQKRVVEFSTAKTIHEAVHLLSFNTGLQQATRDYPFWLSEGLATSFEAPDADEGFGPDRPNPHRQSIFDDLAERGKLLPLRELVTLTDVPNGNVQLAQPMYAQSYALFTYLFRHERDALRAYIQSLDAEPIGEISASHQLDLFTRHFGDPERIARRLRRG